MGDSFEYREDYPNRMSRKFGFGGAPRELCNLKWNAVKLCTDYVRKMSCSGDMEAGRLSDLLDQVGITPGWEPDAVGTEAARSFSSLIEQPNA